MQPIRNAIIEKKRYMLEHECSSDLYDEITHLEEKYEISRQKWLVLYNTQKTKNISMLIISTITYLMVKKILMYEKFQVLELI